MKPLHVALRNARESLGLTQTEVAEKMGVSQSHFSVMEKGDALPIGYFVKLAEHLGLSSVLADYLWNLECDEVEKAVSETKTLSLTKKRIFLAVYGQMTDRDSIQNMEAFLIRKAEGLPQSTWKFKE